MRKTLTLASLAWLLMQAPALAQTAVTDAIITRIEADGYTILEVKRSWLGRIVITANKDQDLREVVLNRRSGEVLRDKNFPDKSNAPDRPEPSENRPPRPDAPEKPEGNKRGE